MMICGGLLLLAAALLLAGWNLLEDQQAAQASEQVLRQMEQPPPAEADPPEEPEEVVPAYVLDPDMEMPETEVDGHLYIGVLEIPALELELPVELSGSEDRPLPVSGVRLSGGPDPPGPQLQPPLRADPQPHGGGCHPFYRCGLEPLHLRGLPGGAAGADCHRGDGERRLGSDAVHLHRGRRRPGDRPLPADG